MDLFELNGRVVVDLADALKAFDTISKEGQQTQSKMSKFFSGVGKGAAVVGKAVGTGLLAAGTAMGGLTIKALNLSGELEQNMGGSEAVFGEYAAKMQETARSAFENMGLSTSDFLGTANKMGALFQGAGFSIEESSGLAADAMQRAADVASIMGIDTASAMEAIAGAAKGNFTMMDNLGVAMNDTTLQAYALEKGINKSTQEMTNQEKIGLAMEMFMEKTAYAAGNYAKENETLAGSLGTAKSALTNFLDGSGTVDQLVGAFTNAATVIVKNVTEIAPRLISGITEVVNQIVPMIPGLLNQLLPVIIEGAVSLINGLVAALPGIISALMGALPALIDGVTQIINALIAALPQIMQALVSALPTLIPMLINGLVSMIVTLCTMLPQIIQPLLAALPSIIISLVNALITNLPLLINGAIQLVVGLVAALPQIIIALVQAMPTVIMMLVQGLFTAAPMLVQGMTTIWNTTVAAVINVVVGLVNTVVNWFVTLKDMAVAKFTELKSRAVEKFSELKSSASEKFASIKSDVTNKIEELKNNIVEKFNNVKSKAASIFEEVKDKMTAPVEKARDTIEGIVRKIEGFFSNMKISFPDIKVPKFDMSGEFSLKPLSVPKISVAWNAKAMDEPYLFTKPTIFDYNPFTGTAKGAGEAGDEVMIGKNTMLNMIQQAVAAENSALAQKLERIIDLLIQFFPEMLEALDISFSVDGKELAVATASAMNTELGKIAIKKGRGR